MKRNELSFSSTWYSLTSQTLSTQHQLLSVYAAPFPPGATYWRPLICILEQELCSHVKYSVHCDLFWEQRYRIFGMPDSFQEEVDDLLPLFPLPEHSLDEWMKDSKYNGVLVNEVLKRVDWD